MQVRGRVGSSRDSSRDIKYSRASSRCYSSSYSDPPDPYEEVKPNRKLTGFEVRNCKDCGGFVANVSIITQDYIAFIRLEAVQSKMRGLCSRLTKVLQKCSNHSSKKRSSKGSYTTQMQHHT